jgi:hypothetical protein
MAVNLHGVIRPTNDVDFIVHLEEENILKFCRLMTQLGYMSKVSVNSEELAIQKKKKLDR